MLITAPNFNLLDFRSFCFYLPSHLHGQDTNLSRVHLHALIRLQKNADVCYVWCTHYPIRSSVNIIVAIVDSCLTLYVFSSSQESHPHKLCSLFCIGSAQCTTNTHSVVCFFIHLLFFFGVLIESKTKTFLFCLYLKVIANRNS